MASEGTARRRYPWCDWTDSAQWLIFRGEDFDLSIHNMQISLHSHARTHGMRVSSRSFTERYRDKRGKLQTRDGLIFQFWPAEK